MGCQSQVDIGDSLTFSICTHDPDTGELTDTDSAPVYRIYEDETVVPILTGTMAKLDGGSTTGYYTELIDCSVVNGFENGKSYTIFIRATVDGITGGIPYAFVAKDARVLVFGVPTDRVYLVLAANRILAVFSENRIYTVPAENRIYVVPEG